MQNDENKRHNHSYKDFSEDTASGKFQMSLYNVINSSDGVFSPIVTYPSYCTLNNGVVQISGINILNFSHTHTHSFTINDSGIDETRPVNLTYIIWRRIA